MKYFKATWSFTLIPCWYCLGRGQKMDALGTSLPRKHQKTCLHVQGSESWESNFLPESCVGPSLPVVPGILTTHFILTLLPVSVDNWTRVTVIMVCCCDDGDVMRALRLKEDQHPLLTSPLTLLLSVSFFVFLSLPLSICLSVSACVCISLSACVSLLSVFLCLSSQFLSMDFILNSFSVSPLFLTTLHNLWDLSFPARDQTHGPSTESS